MASWTSGYVADTEYTPGFYRELTPALLSFVALAHGQSAPDVNSPLTYCELGCGKGYSTNLLAAANPHIEFYANDFNPTHIVGARKLAAEAGSPNVHFLDHSFEEFLVEPTLPAFDIIALHGIYSWINAENRAVIVEFVRRKLKPGGFVYVSYNCLPGWSAAAPLRHLMYLHGQAQGGPTLGRVEPALAFLEKLEAANAGYFRGSPALKDRVQKLKAQPKNYLAHEYMNDNWTLFYHSDVAAEFGEAKVSFLGSAHVLDAIDSISITAEQRQILSEIQNVAFRETVRDYMVNQQFRRDIFVRGPSAQPLSEGQATWNRLRFALTTARDDVPTKLAVAQGEVTLDQTVHAPLLAALNAGPQTFAQLAAMPEFSSVGPNPLRQAIAVLIGAGHVQPCIGGENEALRRERSKAFNAAILERARSQGDMSALASPVTGGGVTLDRISQLFLLAVNAGEEDPAAFAAAILGEQNQRILKDGKTLETPEENLAELAQRYSEFAAKRLPLLKQLGIA